jgi:hypothetical protein
MWLHRNNIQYVILRETNNFDNVHRVSQIEEQNTTGGHWLT